MAARGDLDPEAAGEEFLAWYRSGPADVGIQTRAVLSSARTAAELPDRAAAYYRAHPDRSAGNGSLMRTAPVALAHLGDDQAIALAAREISSLTHADLIAGDACVLWCVAIDRAVRQERLDGITDGLAMIPVARRTSWERHIGQAFTAPPTSFTPNGYVVTALQAALAAVHQTPTLRARPGDHLADALQAAVAIGDDTDTVATTAGALLGARWGAAAVPKEWRRQLHGWPEHQTHDLECLALQIARNAPGLRQGATGMSGPEWSLGPLPNGY